MSAILPSSLGTYLFLIRVYIISWLSAWYQKICVYLKINQQKHPGKPADFNNLELESDCTLLYSQTWEDPRVLRLALRLTEKDHVLAVASAGDSLLALLLDNPQRVVGVDSSFPQIALCHLKVAAVKGLTYEEFRYFLGFTEEVADGRKRREIYRCSLRSLLIESAREYWDRHEEALASGIIHAGRFEQFMRTFSGIVLPLVHSRGQVSKLLSQRGVSGQRELLQTEWNTLAFRALHRIYFSESMLHHVIGRHHARYNSMLHNATERPIGATLLSRFVEKLSSVPVSSSYFFEYLLTGRINGKHTLPDYAQQDNFLILKSRVSRLELIHSDFSAYMRANRRDKEKRSGGFDAVHLAHVPDSTHKTNIGALFRGVLGVVRHTSGARVTHWKLLADHHTETLIPKELRYDAKLSQNLKSDDRVFLYGDFVVQTSRAR